MLARMQPEVPVGSTRPSPSSRQPTAPRLAAALALSCALSVACGSGKAPELKRRNGPVGTLMGDVHLAPGERMPEYLPLDLARRPLRQSSLPKPPDECAGANEAARHPVSVTPRGMLGGIVVAASDFTRVRERAPKVHQVVLEHCRLKPSIIAAQGGDTLSIENRDPFGFEPLIGPAYEARALAQGKKIKQTLVAAGIDAVQCSLGAPCGRTDVLVFHHPVHSVSDSLGQFRMPNFPAGELVRVTAWHPLFEPAETFVWLEPSQVTTLSLQLVPKQRFVPAQSAPSASAAPPAP
jgi:hypothetical protein